MSDALVEAWDDAKSAVMAGFATDDEHLILIAAGDALLLAYVRLAARARRRLQRGA